ncbi:hypothetical protein F4820DRAFT_464640 [Hypoxylon rubiginosum]|uniref:Uncharacterized protein n=1 Tax=Hypoxylon rubiginosum TaxID=110542 RepID=A0ACB9ZBG5_9PEZI|nr:hypothetical protein F4820DRAFT_464640 [Hypoxylon rubiginosum]
MSAGSTAELIRLMTAYDNSHEPRPAFNNRSTVYGLVIPFMVISYICVTLRLYYRIKLRCLGWDDLFVVLFRISATIGSIFLCLALNNGFGEHILTIGIDNIVAFQKKFYVCLATYTISTTLMKLCLLSQYLRIFEVGSRARLICWAGLVISGLWGIAFSFCALFPCFPVSGFWDWTSPARCYGFGSKIPSEIAGTFAGHTGSNVVLDAMVLAIPVPLYFRKSTAGKQRVGIGLLLLLGVIVNLISIWCLQTIVDHKAGTYPVLDPTWYGPKSITLAALEVDLASICASIPTFWPILSQRLLRVGGAGAGSIFVTQEVHITHQHRRLSSDDDENNKDSTATRYELQPAHSRADSTTSLGGASIARVASNKSSLTIARRNYHDDFGFGGGGGGGGAVPSIKEACVEAQVQSDGQRGYEREQERLRLAVVESNNSAQRR